MITDYTKVSRKTWEKLIPMLTSETLNDIAWELESLTNYSPDFVEVLKSEMDSRAEEESMEYKDFLQTLRTISPKDIIYIPGQKDYYQKIYDSLVDIFNKNPSLNVARSEFEDIDESDYNKSLTRAELDGIFYEILAEDDSEDTAALITELRKSTQMFGLNTITTKRGSIHEVIWNRREILKDTVKSLEFLLSKYQKGARPETWRRLM